MRGEGQTRGNRNKEISKSDSALNHQQTGSSQRIAVWEAGRLDGVTRSHMSRETSGSCEDGCLLDCCAALSRRNLPTFHRCLLPPSSLIALMMKVFLQMWTWVLAGAASVSAPGPDDETTELTATPITARWKGHDPATARSWTPVSLPEASHLIYWTTAGDLTR
jgi:hypothetical protein